MAYFSLAAIYRELGREAKLAEHLARARELLSPDDHYDWACVEAIAGNADAAMEHLRQALDETPGYRFWARRDPDLASLHDYPRFRELVEQPGQVHPEGGA